MQGGAEVNGQLSVVLSELKNIRMCCATSG